jgi:lysophospholipase L1-like esterase
MKRLAIILTCALGISGAAQTSERDMPDVLRGVKRILFVGDSLTDGSSYPDYVVNTLNGVFPDAGFEIHNAAVCGDTAAMVRKRLKADIIDRTPDLMVLSIGTNDCCGRRPVKDYEADVDYIVSETLKTGSRVMLVLPSPFGKVNAEREKPFQEYLAAIRRVAAAHSLHVADAHAEFVRGENAGREMLSTDGIHHGRHGFEGMARAIMDALGLKDTKLNMNIKPWPGLLMKWETSDPVPADGKYDPSRATGWKPYDAKALMAKQTWSNSPFPARGAWMPFADPNNKQVAYGRTCYVAKAAGKHELQVGGSYAPQMVWLNGKKVWESRRPHGFHPNADRLIVDMHAGENEIIAVSNFIIFIRVKEK